MVVTGYKKCHRGYDYTCYAKEDSTCRTRAPATPIIHRHSRPNKSRGLTRVITLSNRSSDEQKEKELSRTRPFPSLPCSRSRVVAMAIPCISAVVNVSSSAAPRLRSEETVQRSPVVLSGITSTRILKSTSKSARSSFLAGGSVICAATVSRRQRRSQRSSGVRAAVATEAPPMVVHEPLN